MKLITKIVLVISVLLSSISCNAQIKNAKTEIIKIYGNCGMCKKTIEKSGNSKGTANVVWDADSKMATIIYDEKKTNQNEILKRIALSGYDSDKFLAPDNVYNNLHGCCQYDRVAKGSVAIDANDETEKLEPSKMDMTLNPNHLATATNGHYNSNSTEQPQQIDQLKAVFENYFAVKEALVNTDGIAASDKAKALLLAINTVKMETLKTEVHTVWMTVFVDIKEDAEHISDTKDVSHQRDHFSTLSKNMYNLIKTAKQETATYYQFCPMANNGTGANWLSKDNAVKNPYYGSRMLNCGKVVETIK